MRSRPRAHAGRAGLRLVFNVAVFAASVWFLWDVLKDIGIQAVWRRIAGAESFLVLGVLAANIARFMLLGLRWEILVRAEAPIGYRPTLSILMAGNFLNLVAPGLRVAGPVLRAFYMSKETGRPRARFYGTIVADQTANFSIFIVALVISGALTAAEGDAGITLSSGLAVLGALLGGLYLGKRHLTRLKRGERSLVWSTVHRLLKPDERGKGSESKTRRFLVWWENMLHALANSIVGTGTFWPAMGVSAVLFIVLSVSMQLSMAAVGSPIGLAQAAFAISMAAFVQMLAAAPGGPGITEASLVLIFLALGVDVETAAAGTFVARIMNYAVILPWGGVAFYRLQKKYGAASEGPDGSPAAAEA